MISQYLYQFQPVASRARENHCLIVISFELEGTKIYFTSLQILV